MRYRILLKSGRCWHTDFKLGLKVWDHADAPETIIAKEDGDDTPVNVWIAPDAIESITDMDCG